jgi:N-carbamoyl-L-amino-acid hydrolase
VSDTNLRISGDRLINRLTELGRIGAAPGGGVRRIALTAADRDGRDLLVRWMKDAGLKVRVDRIGNIFGIRKGTTDLSPVMTGSHIDTVLDGGLYDGTLGVLAGLEVVECLNDADLQTERDLVIAAFTNEEGARFQPDMMGSLVYAGGLAIDEALTITDLDGQSVGAELEKIGYAGDMACGEIAPQAFIELHIEQGPVLEREATAIGAVENLQGISWTEIHIRGEANHAGTTPMEMRRDAGYCAAALACRVREITREIGNGQVGTVGTFTLTPSIINVVPGEARLTVDLRNADDTLLIEAENLLANCLDDLRQTERVEIDVRRLARFEPVAFDTAIVERIETNAARLGHACRRMTSGAGHDAQMMARICPTAMIFVPSRDGISHNPAEFTAPEYLIAGADILLQTVLDLTASS